MDHRRTFGLEEEGLEILSAGAFAEGGDRLLEDSLAFFLFDFGESLDELFIDGLQSLLLDKVHPEGLSDNFQPDVLLLEKSDVVLEPAHKPLVAGTGLVRCVSFAQEREEKLFELGLQASWLKQLELCSLVPHAVEALPHKVPQAQVHQVEDEEPAVPKHHLDDHSHDRSSLGLHELGQFEQDESADFKLRDRIFPAYSHFFTQEVAYQLRGQLIPTITDELGPKVGVFMVCLQNKFEVPLAILIIHRILQERVLYLFYHLRKTSTKIGQQLSSGVYFKH